MVIVASLQRRRRAARQALARPLPLVRVEEAFRRRRGARALALQLRWKVPARSAAVPTRPARPAAS